MLTKPGGTSRGITLASAQPNGVDTAVRTGEKILILDSPLAERDTPAVVMPPEAILLFEQAAATEPGFGYKLRGRHLNEVRAAKGGNNRKARDFSIRGGADDDEFDP